jgi:cell division septation protein DedD
MYENGRGVPKDFVAAVNWYRQAAAQGYVGAQLNLGLMYARGQGVPQDYVSAYMWFDLVAATGDKVAESYRDKVAAKLTPSQISEAQGLARGWKPVTAASITSAPITSAPITSASITSAPIASAPITSAPITSGTAVAAPIPVAAPLPKTPASASKPTAMPPPAVAPVVPRTAEAAAPEAKRSVAAQSAPTHTGWIVQIGAFDVERDAQRQLDSAQAKAGHVLDNADPFTEVVVKGDKTLYRARFAGFQHKDAAEAVCKQLKLRDIACMAIKN